MYYLVVIIINIDIFHDDYKHYYRRMSSKSYVHIEN